MANYNRIILAGYMTRDIESRFTQGGMEVGNFGFAVNRKSKDRESTCFVDCTAFGKTCEILKQYVGKGSPLLIEGRLDFQQWEKDGQKRSKHVVIVESFQFLGSSEDNGGGGGRRSGGGRQQSRDDREPEPDYGDIPF